MAKSYYKTIDGKKYDREMIEIAEIAVSGKGDGRISLQDAEALFNTIVDGNTITEIEADTLDYIKENFRFTEAAEKWLSDELADWISRKQAAGEQGLQTTVKPRGRSEQTTAPAQTSAPSTEQAPTSLVWPILVVVLLLLLPVSYFTGKRLAGPLVDPEMQMKVDQLNADLLSKEREIALLNEEMKLLQNQLVEAEKASAEKNQQQPEVREALANEIERLLASELEQDRYRFDRQEMAIFFIPEDPFFAKGSAFAQEPLRELLRDFLPKLIERVKPFHQQVIYIKFQGYSSSEWRYARNEIDAFLKNMKLSNERAESALRYYLTLDDFKQHQDWLDDRLIIGGYSDINPVLDANQQEDPIRSRRVSIAIETKPVENQ